MKAIKSDIIFTCRICHYFPLIKIFPKKKQIKQECQCLNKEEYLMEDLINEGEAHPAEYPNCSSKRHSKKAEKFCLSCQKWLCNKCLEIHPSSVNHKLIFKECYFGDKKNRTKCSTHPHKDVKYFCFDCQLAFCPLCFVLKDHLFHQVENLFINKKEINRLKNSVEAFTEILLNDRKKEIYINQLAKKVQKPYEEVKKKFEINLEMNKHLLSVASSLIALYSELKVSDYSLYSSIKMNCNFNELEAIQEDNFDIIINNTTNYEQINLKKSINNFQKYSHLKLKKIAQEDKKITAGTLLLLKDGRIATSTDNKTIIIYNEFFIKDFEITSESDYCYYLTQLENDDIISIFESNLVKIWEIKGKQYKCKHELSPHNNLIMKIIDLPDNCFATCSWDQTIKIFSLKDLQEITTLTGHSFCVASILCIEKNDILISGSYCIDKALRIWDIKSYTLMNKVDEVECMEYNSLIQYDENHILSGGDKKVYLIDIVFFKVVSELLADPELGFVKSMILFPNLNCLVVGGGIDNERGNLMIYNTKTGEVIKQRDVHKSCVYSMGVHMNRYLITCSCSIKVWDIRYFNK